MGLVLQPATDSTDDIDLTVAVTTSDSAPDLSSEVLNTATETITIQMIPDVGEC